MKDKYYIIATVLVIIMAVGAIVYKNRTRESGLNVFESDTEDTEEEMQEENNNLSGENDNNGSAMEEVGNFIEGVLNNSDNPERGNLKLISNLGEIYIRTNKDFSSLIGSKVLVTIEGTLDNFRLVDIQAKLESNGFINVQ